MRRTAAQPSPNLLPVLPILVVPGCAYVLPNTTAAVENLPVDWWSALQTTWIGVEGLAVGFLSDLWYWVEKLL